MRGVVGAPVGAFRRWRATRIPLILWRGMLHVRRRGLEGAVRLRNRHVMRILHLGNYYFAQSLRDFGHDVLCVGLQAGSDVRLATQPVTLQELGAQLPGGWRPDLVLLGDASAYPLVVGLEFLAVPLVWYAIDSHLHLSWHMQYATVFDVILVAQRDFVRCYRADPLRQVVEWAPLFCSPSSDRDMGLVRDLPLSFVGTLNPKWNPDRVALIDGIRQRMPIHVENGPYLDVFNRSQIVLNQSVANDVNFRTFQVMACGALLLTERTGNGFGELFQEGRHCLAYDHGSVEQVVEQVAAYRDSPAARAAIAEAGREEVLAKHTVRHRTEQLLAVLAQADLSRMVAERRAHLMDIQACLMTVYEISWRQYVRAALRYEPGEAAFSGSCRIAARYRRLADAIRTEFDRLVQAEPPASPGTPSGAQDFPLAS